MGHGWKRVSLALLLAASALVASGTAGAAKVGDKAAPFALPSTTGKELGSKDFAGKTLVLFFYSGAFTNS